MSSLQQYYQRLLPWYDIYLWLNQSETPTNMFTDREFGAVFRKADGGEAFSRYCTYADVDAFKKAMVSLAPERFEIGAVFSVNPSVFRNASKSKLFPIAKELNFDIDLTDYDDVRTCCQGKDICIKCWQFITVAIHVIDKALREDFGFEHLLWVFSGRRGAHCWVSDAAARKLDDVQRKSIVSYLSLQTKNGRTLVRRPLHPHIERSVKFLATRFEKNILVDQDPWCARSGWEKLLDLISHADLVRALRTQWEKEVDKSSKLRWRDITKFSEGLHVDLASVKENLILACMYPRLDANVTCAMNHLLKSPFCVHPSTNKVCVPIDKSKVDLFDPRVVPTLEKVLSEIDNFSDESTLAAAGVNCTSLGPHLTYFADYAKSLVRIKRAPDLF